MNAWQKRARLVMAIVGLAVVLLVVLTIRRRPSAEQTAGERALDPKAVTEATGGRILPASGSKNRGPITFDNQLTYADGSMKLIGPCATTTREGREMRVCAREAHIAAKRAHVNMTGDVRISSKDGLQAQTDEATYSEAEGIVRARGKVTFSKGALTGSAVGMSYDDERDLLSLQSQVTAQIAAGKEGGATDISSGAAEYARTEKQLRFAGSVRMLRAGRL